jgi:hypothetical protein
MEFSYSDSKSGKRLILVRLACRDFSHEVLLLIVQILQLQVQSIDFLPGFCSRLLRLPNSQDGIPVEPAELGKQREENLLLF